MKSMIELGRIFIFFSALLALTSCAACEKNVEHHFDVGLEVIEVISVVDLSLLVESKKNSKIYSKWQAFEESYESGDCIYRIVSDKESWRRFSGFEAYIIFRKGQPHSSIIVRVN